MGKVKPGPLARRPDNSAFQQQRLPAWSPMLTANTVLPFFYFMALICMLLGVWLLLTVQSTEELKLDYTEAGTWRRLFLLRPHKLPSEPPQIHGLQRRCSDVGRKNNLKSPSSYCMPFDKDTNGVPIAPCGAVANSIFNDSFTLSYMSSSGSASPGTDGQKHQVPSNPSTENMTLPQVFEGTAPPLYWQKPVYDLDPLDKNNNGFINDDLIVWMREAAFPNFKKLYGGITASNNLTTSLCSTSEAERK
ncbi:hypothetical protein KUCAC02_010341 [Chaenocephalus aceratus]|uniref:Uncharacterized protein n=1 Tax=Chaenocephalus aceratus TaxID=36190 RepID=A0ACB9W030_CHAAC|nr:hypothetical protein KUCAC02_010341 [Chaenocephalus aceratus]